VDTALTELGPGGAGFDRRFSNMLNSLLNMEVLLG
jgi:hypothetical protein